MTTNEPEQAEGIQVLENYFEDSKELSRHYLFILFYSISRRNEKKVYHENHDIPDSHHNYDISFVNNQPLALSISNYRTRKPSDDIISPR